METKVELLGNRISSIDKVRQSDMSKLYRTFSLTENESSSTKILLLKKRRAPMTLSELTKWFINNNVLQKVLKRNSIISLKEIENSYSNDRMMCSENEGRWARIDLCTQLSLTTGNVSGYYLLNSNRTRWPYQVPIRKETIIKSTLLNHSNTNN